MPNVPVVGKYTPVVLSPTKFNEGADAEPLPKIKLEKLLLAPDAALNTLVPSQARTSELLDAIVTTAPPPADVFTVNEYDPLEQRLVMKYNCTVCGTIIT